MFSFTNPLLLLFLLAVPPLAWWRMRRGSGALRFSDTRLLANLPRGRSDWVGKAEAVLRAAALVLLILALAGPRWPDPGTRIPTEGIAIAMVVDVSRSMTNQDFLWDNQPISRLEAVKKAFRLMVEGGPGPDGRQLSGRPQDLVSLVTYATRPETACPLTLNHGVLLQILDGQKPRTLTTEATTNSGDAIAWALHGLQNSSAKRKVLVVLSDGEHNVPPPALKPRQAAQLAGNLGIPIYAINAGNELGDDGQPTEESVQARKTLQEVANISRGQYFQAGDSEKLVDACAQIDRLEKQEIHSFQYRRYHEGFFWLAIGSLILWVLIHGLATTVWRRIP